MLLYLSKNWWSMLTCTTEEENDGRVVDCNTSWMPPLAHLRVSRNGRDTSTRRFSAFLMSLSLILQVKGAPLDSGTGLFCILKWNPVFGLAVPPIIGGRLRQPHGRLLLTMWWRPVYMVINASLTRRNHVLETVKKVELWSLDFTTLSGSRVKKHAKIQLCYLPIWIQHCLECHNLG